MPFTPFSRLNAEQQDFDVAGSSYQNNNRVLTDETGGLGLPVVLNSGSSATITAFASPNLTVGGLTGQSAASVGTIIVLTLAGESGNNGAFTVTSNTSASVNVVSDAAGFFPDSNSGSIEWAQYNAGATASITTVTGGVATLTGLQNLSANSVGRFLTITGAASAGNNGTFLIINFNSATSVDVANASAVASDGNNGAISWVERNPYVVNDDFDFERTDRTAIKGVNYDQPVPNYTRPTLTGVNVPASLANIAGKTLDAFARNVNRGQFKWAVEVTLTDLYGVGNFKHSDNVDQTGVPVFDAGPFTSDWNSCFVEVTDALTGNELEVLAGLHIGERIFGVTYNGTSTSPNSVEIHWYSAPNGSNVATSATAYSWEQGASTVKTGTTSVTIVAGANGASALTGLTAGGFASPADVGSWLTVSGATNPANNGTFVITSVQSGTAVTVQNHAAISEGPTAAVTWTQHSMTQPTFVDLTYGFNQRLDQLDQNAFRFPLISGLTGDADLRQDIIDIQSTGGWADGTTNLSTYLTNTTGDFVFSTLGGGAADTVVAALNALNTQIGNRNYTGAILTSGQTITASLQALSAAISATTITGYIERLAVDAPANTSHLLPGGATYVPDGTNNARGLVVFWNGVLRDPGSVANGDDYAETNATHITPFSKIKSGQHIRFLVV